MQDKEAKFSHPKTISAFDIMSEVVVTVQEEIMIRDAAHLMLRDRVHGLPIVDKNKNIIGMLTLTDLFALIDKAASHEHYDFYKELFKEKTLKTSEVMTRKVHAIALETTLDEIIRIMLTEKIHTIPVVKDKKIVGIIGRHDVLNAVFAFD